MEITVPFASYKLMRFFAILGSILGVMQSIAWLGITITGIVGYFCGISFTGTGANYGTIIQLTLYHMYFRGECTDEEIGFPNVEFQPIEALNLLSAFTVNVFMWVMASLSFIWLFSSLTVLINVKKSNLRYANAFLLIWIFTTIVIAIIDLALFILFALDYDTIWTHSTTFNLNFQVAVTSVLIAAQNSAGILMSVALRGYILWLLNIGIALFLLSQTFKISKFNKDIRNGTNQGIVNPGFKNEDVFVHSANRSQPIKAFETSAGSPWYTYLTTDIPRVSKPQGPSLVRSTSMSGLEESFVKRQTIMVAPDNRNSTNHPDVVLRRDQNRTSANFNNTGYVQSPQPKFEPRPPLKTGILRNSRYQ